MFLEIASDRITLINSFKISIFVGIILNLINQGKALFNFSEFSIVKFRLTFLVPFFVSVYSSTNTKLNFYPGDIASISGNLKCNNCKLNELKIDKGTEIKECAYCKKHTEWKIID